MVESVGLQWRDWLVPIGGNGAFYDSANTIERNDREAADEIGELLGGE